MAYRVEYARSGRSGCKGPKPCNGTKIDKGSLRLGSVIEIRGERSLVWRHWGCVTDKVISNLVDGIGDPEDLDGYEDLNEEDQSRVSRAFANGHIDADDVTQALVDAGKSSQSAPPTPQTKKPKKKTKGKVEDSDADEEEVSDHEAEGSSRGGKAKQKSKSKKAPSKTVKEEDAAGVEMGPQSKSKKRGRSSNTSTDPPEAVQEEKDDQDEGLKKKRGRPAKESASSNGTGADKVASSPKGKSVDHAIGSSGSIVEKKKRGRPSKTEAQTAEKESVKKPASAKPKATATLNGKKKSAAKEAEAGPSNTDLKRKRGRPSVKLESEASGDAAPLEASSEIELKRKRGRPSKDAAKPKAAINNNKKLPGKSVKESPEKRRRGRPPKVDSANSRDGSRPVQIANEVEIRHDIHTKKKRGRPSKSDILSRAATGSSSDDVFPQPDAVVENLQAPVNGKPSVSGANSPNKRGRPKKEKSISYDIIPKRRGRPKKDKSLGQNLIPKARGRPKKEKAIEHAGNAIASPRKRGRPKLEKSIEPEPNIIPKKRGRPKKEKSIDPNRIPKKRGRPPKALSNTNGTNDKRVREYSEPDELSSLTDAEEEEGKAAEDGRAEDEEMSMEKKN